MQQAQTASIWGERRNGRSGGITPQLTGGVWCMLSPGRSAFYARVAKLADARDLKSRAPKGACRFNSGPGHQRLWAAGLGLQVSGSQAASSRLQERRIFRSARLLLRFGCSLAISLSAASLG